MIASLTMPFRLYPTKADYVQYHMARIILILTSCGTHSLVIKVTQTIQWSMVSVLGIQHVNSNTVRPFPFERRVWDGISSQSRLKRYHPQSAYTIKDTQYAL
jgi:hypothetical protein